MNLTKEKILSNIYELEMELFEKENLLTVISTYAEINASQDSLLELEKEIQETKSWIQYYMFELEELKEKEIKDE